MNGHLVVKRYARALYEAVRDASASDELMRDMESLDTLMALPELRDFCLNGNPSPEKSRVFVETALLPYLGDFTRRAVKLLGQNRRLEALPLLSTAVREERDRDLGITRVLVESVSAPDEELKQDVLRALKKRIDGEIEAEWNQKPELLGGVSVQWNNRLLDLSVKNRLTGLKRVLNRKAV